MAKVLTSTGRWMTRAYQLYANLTLKPPRSFCTASLLYSPKKEEIIDHRKYAKVTFQLPDKREVSVDAEVGDNFLEVISDNNVDIDGFGACEGTLACSTCHLVFPKEAFARIIKEQRPISDDEEDMLDLAQGRTDTSRLGCQVKVAEWMNGLKIVVPASSDIRLG